MVTGFSVWTKTCSFIFCITSATSMLQFNWIWLLMCLRDLMICAVWLTAPQSKTWFSSICPPSMLYLSTWLFMFTHYFWLISVMLIPFYQIHLTPLLSSIIRKTALIFIMVLLQLFCAFDTVFLAYVILSLALKSWVLGLCFCCHLSYPPFYCTCSSQSLQVISSICLSWW